MWTRIAKSQRHELNFPTILPVLHELLYHLPCRKRILNQLLLLLLSHWPKHNTLSELPQDFPRLPNRPNNLLPSLRLRMLISTAMAKDRSRMIRSVNKAQRPRHRLSLKNPFPTKSPIRRQPRAHRMIILLTMDVTRTTTMVHMRTKASALAVVL